MKVVHHPGKDDDDKECLTHLIGAAWGILVMALAGGNSRPVGVVRSRRVRVFN